MPQRTNDFQAVVYFIKQHLAPDAEVTESAMLRDRQTGALREVDVVMTGTIGGHQVTIGIEVRGQKKKQSVEWVEQTHSKHSRLPIHQTVLVSRSGFTREAERVAARYGIELVTPGQPIGLEGPLGDLRIQVELKEVQYLGEVVIGVVAGSTDTFVQVRPATKVFSDDGTFACLLSEWLSAKRKAG